MKYISHVIITFSHMSMWGFALVNSRKCDIMCICEYVKNEATCTTCEIEIPYTSKNHIMIFTLYGSNYHSILLQIKHQIKHQGHNIDQISQVYHVIIHMLSLCDVSVSVVVISMSCRTLKLFSSLLKWQVTVHWRCPHAYFQRQHFQH